MGAYYYLVLACFTVAIARPLLLNPRLMLLDEPSQGLAPLIVKEVMQVVRRMREEGLSVLLRSRTYRCRFRSPTAPMCWTTAGVVYCGSAPECRP